jgi:Putative zinc-finger/Tetratricopeptide repeat
VSRHVVDEVVEYLEGRLSPERRAEADAHLSECEECAADYAFARESRDAAVREGRRHLTPERIVELAEDGAPAPTEDEARHLQRCERCSAEVSWMRSTPPVVDALGGKVVPVPGARRPWTAFLLLAASLAAIVLWQSGGGDRHLDRLARLEPLPVHLTREAPTDPFEQDRLRGLQRYSESDWDGARQALARALAARPDREELRLYLASAALLGGDTAAAIRGLRSLVASADPRIREEADWQLANALLLTGDAEEAISLLEDMTGGTGRHAADAAELLGRIDSSR